MSLQTKRAGLAAAAVLFLALRAVPAAMAAPAEAPLLTDGVTVSPASGQSAAALRDQDRSTFLALGDGESITVQSETPVCGLYIIWDAPPSPWRLVTPGGGTGQGGGGFLHEFVPLAAPESELTIALGAGGVICEIYLLGEGEAPAWVQRWQPTLERADLLLLPTHADDEHLFFGGIMPTYAGQRGMDVQVVYMTNHWGERYRPHELLDGLWTVGITAYPVMGPFPDLYASKESLAAAEECFGRGEVLSFQVETLRRFKPFVVVGHDLAGEYGHGAHMLNAATLAEALALCGDAGAMPESAEEYGVWEPQKVYLHLYAENAVVMNWDIPLARFGGATAFEMAQEGFARHASQTAYFSVQQGGTWQDCRKFGLIHTTVGADTQGGDLFENVDTQREAPPPPPAIEPPPPAPAPGADISSRQPAPGKGAAGSWAVSVALAAIAAGIIAATVVIAIVAALRSRKKK